jgi:chorismate dehydratase
MPRARISAISFLNAAPLMWDFEHGRAAQQMAQQMTDRFEISYTIPSKCAAALAAGEADIGLIPSVTYLTIPDLVIIPDIAIAAKGPVRSILLVSRRPVQQVRSVAADISSRTSVALCRLLMKNWLRRGQAGPQFVEMEPQLETMLARCDAALLIGDSALRVQRDQYPVVLDLAEEWLRHTGKPFVFAFWAVRAAAAQPDFARIFCDSRDHGLEPASIAALSREWAPRVGIAEPAVSEYLSEAISYSLDSENLAGLELFWKLGAEAGLLPAPVPLRFLESSVVAEAASKRT